MWLGQDLKLLLQNWFVCELFAKFDLTSLYPKYLLHVFVFYVRPHLICILSQDSLLSCFILTSENITEKRPENEFWKKVNNSWKVCQPWWKLNVICNPSYGNLQSTVSLISENKVKKSRKASLTDRQTDKPMERVTDSVQTYMYGDLLWVLYTLHLRILLLFTFDVIMQITVYYSITNIMNIIWVLFIFDTEKWK